MGDVIILLNPKDPDESSKIFEHQHGVLKYIFSFYVIERIQLLFYPMFGENKLIKPVSLFYSTENQ